MVVLKEEFLALSLRNLELELAKETKSSNQREFCQRILEMIPLPIPLQSLRPTLKMVCIRYLQGVLFQEMWIFLQLLGEERLHLPTDRVMLSFESLKSHLSFLQN